MVMPIPALASDSGIRKVPITAPIRDMETASPTALARISVGKISFGYTSGSTCAPPIRMA
ncbi:hypothetical protein D3C79_1106880 [compost metagenome]